MSSPYSFNVEWSPLYRGHPRTVTLVGVDEVLGFLVREVAWYLSDPPHDNDLAIRIRNTQINE